MFVKESDIVNKKELYLVCTGAKEKIDSLLDTVFEPTSFVIHTGKYSDALMLCVDNKVYVSYDRPVVDSFNTIRTTLGVNTTMTLVKRTSSVTGKDYFVLEPVFMETPTDTTFTEV